MITLTIEIETNDRYALERVVREFADILIERPFLSDWLIEDDDASGRMDVIEGGE